MAKKILALTFLSLALSTGAFAADVPSDKNLNTGEDITHPPSTFDIRYKYQLLDEKRSQNTFTLRTDRSSFFTKSWGLGTRFDLPCVLTNNFSICRTRDYSLLNILDKFSPLFPRSPPAISFV